jgi:hypothetical protein
VRCLPALFALAGACASRPPVVEEELEADDEWPGTCVGAGTAGTRVEIRAIDRDAITFCGTATTGGEPPVCRKVELATGAMIEPTPVPPLPAGPGKELVNCTGHNECHLEVCADDGSCKRVDPVAGEWFVRAARGFDGRVAAGSQAPDQKAFVTVLDPAQVETARFAVAWPLGDVVWLVEALAVMTSNGQDTRVALYTPAGDPLGLVGGDDGPLAVDDHVPMRVARTAYAWLSADAMTLAVHDVRKRVRGRIDLQLTGVEPYVSAARGTPDGRVVIALGGARFGDIVVVEPGDGVVTTRPARRCDPASGTRARLERGDPAGQVGVLLVDDLDLRGDVLPDRLRLSRELARDLVDPVEQRGSERR